MTTDAKTFFHRFDWILAGATLLLFLIGLSTIYSTVLAGQGLSGSLVVKQLIAAGIGIVSIVVIVRFDIRMLRVIIPIVYVFLVLSLVVLLLTADPIRGASSWFVIGGFQFQPSEFLKIALIVILASYCSHFGQRMREWKVMAGFFCVLALPLLLIVLQPDLGTAVVILVIGATILFFSRSNFKKLGLLVLIAIILLPFGYNSLADYQKARITSFLDPTADPLGAGYNQIQSVIAVGSGGFWGRGWGRGTQSHLRFLPEQHTDFIFATYTEEFGFVGAGVLLILVILILARLLFIAKNTQDDFSFLIIMGILGYFSFQVFFNIGMNIGLFPVTGLPLPLMSYGGSSLITTCLAIGLAEAVAMQRTN